MSSKFECWKKEKEQRGKRRKKKKPLKIHTPHVMPAGHGEPACLLETRAQIESGSARARQATHPGAPGGL